MFYQVISKYSLVKLNISNNKYEHIPSHYACSFFLQNWYPGYIPLTQAYCLDVDHDYSVYIFHSTKFRFTIQKYLGSINWTVQMFYLFSFQVFSLNKNSISTTKGLWIMGFPNTKVILKQIKVFDYFFQFYFSPKKYEQNLFYVSVSIKVIIILKWI